MLEQTMDQTRDFLNGSVSIAIGIAMSGRAQPKKAELVEIVRRQIIRDIRGVFRLEALAHP